MNGAGDYDDHGGNKNLSQDSKWLTRIGVVNANVDLEDGSSNSQGHYVTKSEIDSSDESGDDMSRNGFDLSRKSGSFTAMIDGYGGRNGSAALIQCSQGADGQLYLSSGHGSSFISGNSQGPEDTSRKRELRLLKNKEAAKECRRKKKEYVKCLENRVMVLEAQNKTLIDELKALKELYCQRDSK